MSFVSLSYGLFLLIGVLVYYCIPKKGQWIWLLLLGMFFYAVSSPAGSLFLLFGIVSSYLYGMYCSRCGKQHLQKKKKLWLAVAIFANLFLLLFFKVFLRLPFLAGGFWQRFAAIVPIGISFYTLQIIAYMVDVQKGKIEPERNLLRYALFVSFFPQILQGPIPRFKQLSGQFQKEHRFVYTRFIESLMLMLWGFFQKLVVADNAAIIVNRIFGEYETYGGVYVLIGAFLYSIQLYADFAGCVCIARGSAGLFDIHLIDNFDHPYFSCSVKEFWGRWHISLSSFLKDYVYIPLGGNRKGKLRKYINLLLTFLVSGIWHGAGLSFLVWGMLHGLYQIAEDALAPVLTSLAEKLHIRTKTASFRLLLQIKTFVLVAFAWIFFRADSVRMALHMCRSVVTDRNLYVLF
ncbi:MAG: MBOAT family protein, partial [Lachnospiraceae bacterium]|nr:MBOAT family protein [Lachnospiraceae bacterium]